MEQIIVTRKDSSTWTLFTRSAVSSVTKGEQKRELLGEDVVTMTVVSAIPLTFSRGDKITVFGSTYTLHTPPKEKKSGKRRFSYDVTWEGRQYDLLDAKYLDEGVDGVSISLDFPLTGTLSFFMQVLINNLVREFGSGKWVLGTCPETDYKTLTFSNENCLEVLQRLLKEDVFNKEFEIIEASGVCTINIKDAIGQNLTTTFRYGKGKGLYDLSREAVSDKNLVTRLYAFGSNRNLPSNYRGFSQRLKLPVNDKSYIEDAAAIVLYGRIEGGKFFNEIYPRRTGNVTSLGVDVYKFIDSGMDFDLNATDIEGNTLYLIAGTSAKIHFNTGNLAGYDFEILSYVHSTKTFTLKAFKDERGQIFPDADSYAFQFDVDDIYVITDIVLPQSYIDAAESELEDAAETYLQQNCQPRVKYSLIIDELFLINFYPGETIVNFYGLGDYLPVEDTDISVDKSIRVKSFKRDLVRHYNYKLDLSDIIETSILQRTIASTIETEKLITLNKLNDVARARRSWKSTRELLDMIFDTDDYFNGDNIRPSSIETLMLEVGQRSQQFVINCIIEPNFEGNENVVNVNSGVLSHYGISDTIKDWSITGGETTLLNSGSYYIYAKCAKASGGGTIIFSQSQIKTDDDANFYHFMLGILHGIDESTGTRWISLTYGATSVNGRYIKTGIIVSQDGTTWFDLDSGEISGVIKFVGGQVAKRTFNSQPVTPYGLGDVWIQGDTGDIMMCTTARATGDYVAADWEKASKYTDDTVANSAASAASAAQGTANSAAAAASAAQGDATSALNELSNIGSDDVLSKVEKPQCKLNYDIIIAEQSGIDARATAYGITTEKTTYDNAVSALTSYLTGLSPAYTDFTQNTTIVGTTFRTKFQDVYTTRQTLLNKIYEVAKSLADTAQSSANTAQGTANSAASAASAAQGTANSAAAAASAAQGDATSALNELSNIGSDDVLSKVEKPQCKLNYDIIIAEQSGIDAKATAYGITTEKTTYDNAVSALSSYLTGLSPAYTDFTQNTTIVGTTFRTKFQDVYTARQALLNLIYDKAKDAAISAADSAASAAHAARTKTTIDAGLITTGRIEVGSGDLGDANAGITGDETEVDPNDDIRIWGGASFVNRANAPFWVKHGGAMRATGIVEFGTSPTGTYDNGRGIAIKDNQIYETLSSADESDAGIDVNKYGYQGGQTKYRCFTVYDGRGNRIFAAQGGINRRTVFDNLLYANTTCEVSLSRRHSIATGTSNITCSSTEADMTSMSLSITPKSDKIKILFSAPFTVTAGSQTLKLYINVGGSNVRKCVCNIYTNTQVISFQHIASVTPMAAITVKMRWSGSTAILQRGSTDSERIMTVEDLL